MVDHRDIDKRSLALASAIAERIDSKPELLVQVRLWASRQKAQAYKEWVLILEQPWESVRERLLDPGEEGQRLRQSSPFVGILSPRERWEFFPLEPQLKKVR